MLPASPLNQGTNDETEASPASEPSRPTEQRRRPPPVRDALATLNEEDFDFHDTIPAPPWLEEAEALEEPPLPRR